MGSLVYWLLCIIYLTAIFLLICYGVHRFYHAFKVPAVPPPSPPLCTPSQHITIQLPLYNEQHVVESLLHCICAMDWPSHLLEIQVLDDSTDKTSSIAQHWVKHYAQQGLDIHYLHRRNRIGYKAGALQEGLQQAKGEFIAIFDADFRPAPSFLKFLMTSFKSQQIGLVQARWGHSNRNENLLTQSSAILLDGHFIIEHAVRHHLDCFFNFNGTAGIWRKQCILDAGGWQHDTITEDLDLSYRAQLLGWQFIYRADITAFAELPNNITDFRLQQYRWTKGSIQTARKLLLKILRSSISFSRKRETFFHLTVNLGYPLCILLIILSPIMILGQPKHIISEMVALSTSIFLWGTLLSTVFFYATAQKLSAHRQSLRLILAAIALGIGISFSQTLAVVSGLISRDSTFIRTPKKGSQKTHQYSRRKKFQIHSEFVLSLYSFAILYMLYQKELFSSMPFFILFLFIFLWTSYLNVSHTLIEKNARRTSATQQENIKI